ncbi:TPA: hypothetical protein JBA90_14065 [Legionella pneumophila subsp. pneumophila]|nr:hypothetical protein [Legionella pneumophila subsp. pneumophila]HDO7863839.1 hypothetical protein [Legionella pneumophila]HDO8082921.1 hypothetical protein [Legionella pneumophila]HDO8145927.1 hypothetical protein [Legionella pneumophila]HDO8169716.1 hypothetical protein [Legionella pneumophila]
MTNESDVYFNKDKQQKVIDWINAKWNQKKCEVCQHNSWELADFLVVSPRFEGNLTLGGKVAPHVLVTCKNCANTKFFNAVMVGIIDRNKDE